MTEEQAKQMIALLISIDLRLQRIESGESTMDVSVQNKVAVFTEADDSVTIYER